MFKTCFKTACAVFMLTLLSNITIGQTFHHNIDDAKKLAEDVFKLTTGKEVEDFSRARLEELAPHILHIDRAKILKKGLDYSI